MSVIKSFVRYALSVLFFADLQCRTAVIKSNESLEGPVLMAIMSLKLSSPNRPTRLRPQKLYR